MTWSGDVSGMNDITAQDMALYLTATGWEQRRVENPNLQVFRKGGTDAEVAVPLNPAFRDYNLQLRFVFRVLQDIEERPAEEIVPDVISTWADIIRIRINPPSFFERNTVNLTDGIELIDESYKLLTAAARSSEKPQNVYTGGVTSSVAEYLKRTQLGHTEKGSFVVKIFSPIAPSTRDRETTRPEPFARRVTLTLHNSLEGIRLAAKAQERALTSIFEELVPIGVSANLCDALAQIAEVSNDRAIDVNLTWSWRSLVEHQKSVTTVIPPIITPALRDMSKYLRVMQPEPNVQLTGTVVKLSNLEQAGADFGLGIEAQVDGRLRKIALELKAEARAIASEAWESGATVLCIGTLDRRKSPYRLVQPTTFEIVRASGDSEDVRR
jgi:hypothetical protein